MATIDQISFSARPYKLTPPLEVANRKTEDLNSVRMEFTSLLLNETDALVLRDQISDMRNLKRKIWSLKVVREWPLLEVGDCITLYSNRFGLKNGGKFLIRGIRREADSAFDTLSLYGPE